ncbi:MAG: TonB-dependent receptor [Cytophagales bacterium]|nr:TonB-dependent receptor [Cytophagales bacterium]
MLTAQTVLDAPVKLSLKEGTIKEVLSQIERLTDIKFIYDNGKIDVNQKVIIAKDKTSFMVSGRRTYLDLIAKPFTDDSYNFFDINAKINHRFSDRSRVYFSAYAGRDKGSLLDSQQTLESVVPFDPIHVENQNKSRVEWGNSIALLRWNYVITPKLFSNLSLTRSSYDFEASDEFFQETKNATDTLTQFQYFRTSSDIRDLGVKLDFDFFPHPDHYVRFGLQAIDHNFKPNVVGMLASERVDTTFNTSDINAREYSFYVEDDFKLSAKFQANMGVHLSGFDVNSKFYKSIQPRISLRYLLNENFSVKASYSQMAQFLHLLTNPGLGLPTDLWVPATDKIAPQESSQYSLGFAYSLPELGLEATIEGYYKELDNLIEYQEGANFLRLNEDWQDKVVSGRGESYGMEFFIRRNWDKMEGWLGYTLAWSNRTFEEINLFNAHSNSSLYDIEGLPYKINQKLVIELVRGDDFMKKHKIDYIDFLKLGIEGAEFDALKGFENSIKHTNIKAIQFEYGYINISTKKLLIDYYKFFESNGYIVGKIFPKLVEFRKYDFKYEDFLGPNFIAVSQSDSRLIY